MASVEVSVNAPLPAMQIRTSAWLLCLNTNKGDLLMAGNRTYAAEHDLYLVVRAVGHFSDLMTTMMLVGQVVKVLEYRCRGPRLKFCTMGIFLWVPTWAWRGQSLINHFPRTNGLMSSWKGKNQQFVTVLSHLNSM